MVEESHTPWRYRWSHEAWPHRLAMRGYNAIIGQIPFGLKYGLGRLIRAKRYPYRLFEQGFTAVQVGAPRDTLLSGRSRAMYFCLFAGEHGRVFIVEPDGDSIRCFKEVLASQGIENAKLLQMAAWSEQKRLIVYVDDNHPASNFSKGSKNYDDNRMKDYRSVELPADSLDNMIGREGLGKVDLVSITTNGAEREILQGMAGLIAKGLPYICLAFTGDGYIEMMREFGYELLSHDDRGFTFSQIRKMG